MAIQQPDGSTPNPTKENEYVESFERLKRKNTIKRIRRGVVYTFLILMLLFVFACIVAAVFFRVGKIEVVGESVYSVQEIIDASGIQNGDNILLLDGDEISNRVSDVFPFVRSIRALRSLPSTVKLNVECDMPAYYTEIGDEYFLISDNIRVLAKSGSLDELIAPYQGIKKIRIAEVSRAVVGEKMVFKTETYTQSLEELLDCLKKSDVFSGITSIDITDKFNISAIYDHRLKALLGNISDMGVKLMFLNGIVADLGNSNGTIDIKDAEVGYVLLSSEPVYE